MAHPVDQHVGARLRELRQLKALSKADLARLLEVPSQVIDFYESGIERIGSSHLWELSGIFAVPVDYFFADIEEAAGPGAEMADEEDTTDDEMATVSDIKFDLFNLVRPTRQARGRH